MNDLKDNTELAVTDVELHKVNEDVSRFEATKPWIFIEEINFRNDSGYNARTLYHRVKASIDRAFTSCTGKVNDETLLNATIDKLPPFKPGNKVVITIKVVE